jgi:hypothetical protein
MYTGDRRPALLPNTLPTPSPSCHTPAAVMLTHADELGLGGSDHESLRASVGSTNGASLSGNHYWLYGYVENHRLFLKVRTIEQKLIEAKSAPFKAECSLLHIRMFVGAAADGESQLI